MYFVKSPAIAKPFYRDFLWKVNTQKKEVYLTFDDGPHAEITPWVLSQLKKYKAKATFFCLGKNIKEHPTVFKQILEEEHTVGNHSFAHPNGWKTETQNYLQDIEQCQQLHAFRFFRPPYGKITQSQVKAVKQQFPALKLVMWDVLSGDFDVNISAEKCVQNVLKNVENGSIIVFHDSEKAANNLKNSLPQILEYLIKEGYEFKALPY